MGGNKVVNTLIMAIGFVLLAISFLVTLFGGIGRNDKLLQMGIIFFLVSLFIAIYASYRFSAKGMEVIEEMARSGKKIILNQDPQVYNIKIVKKQIKVKDGADIIYWEVIE